MMNLWKPLVTWLGLCVMWLYLVPAPAGAVERVALVVGVSNYDNTLDLTNPVRDATSIAGALEAIGFTVDLQLDIDQTQFGEAILNFERRADGAEAALFYFAGHGIQIDAQNYLLASNAKVSNPHLIDQDGMRLSRILDAMQARSRTSIAIIDACRDNPLAAALLQNSGAAGRSLGLGRGLAPLDSNYSNSLVTFATAPGAIAYDGEGWNSPFTKALLRHISTPDLEVSVMLKRVTGDVIAETQGAQRPEVVASMAREFYFVQPNVTIEGDVTIIQESTSSDAEAFRLLEAAREMPEGAPRLSALKLLQARFPESAAADFAEILIEQEQAALDAATNAAKPEPPVISENRTRLSSLPLDVGVGQFVADGDRPPEEIEASLQLSKDEYGRIQTILKDLGYELGVVDGDFGRRSRVALADFQSEAGFDPTGFLSETSIAELVDIYATTPETLDGDWALRINRKWLVDDQKGPARAGAVENVATLRLVHRDGGFAIESFQYWATLPPAPFEDFVIDVGRDGDALFSGTISYLFQTPEAPTPKMNFMTANLALPKRVQVGHTFDFDGNKPEAELVFNLSLSRLSAAE